MPASRSTVATLRATSCAAPASGWNAPRRVEIPARARFSPSSHGLNNWWCLAAEPKSHSTGSPPRGSTANRISLSIAHVPMWVDVMYRMFAKSNVSNPPSDEASSVALSRASRSSRSRSRSIRCSQSTAFGPNVRMAMAPPFVSSRVGESQVTQVRAVKSYFTQV